MTDSKNVLETERDFESLCRELAHKRMVHYGFDQEQIDDINEDNFHTSDCERWEDDQWVCSDEYGHSFHPIADELLDTAEFVGWVLEELIKMRKDEDEA